MEKVKGVKFKENRDLELYEDKSWESNLYEAEIFVYAPYRIWLTKEEGLVIISEYLYDGNTLPYEGDFRKNYTQFKKMVSHTYNPFSKKEEILNAIKHINLEDDNSIIDFCNKTSSERDIVEIGVLNS